MQESAHSPASVLAGTCTLSLHRLMVLITHVLLVKVKELTISLESSSMTDNI